MSWQFVLHPAASDELRDLPADVDERIRAKLEEMVTNEWRDLLEFDVQRVRGCDLDIYRTRIGGYRVFFLCDEPIAAILRVDSRDGAYRNTSLLDDRGSKFGEQ